MPPSLPLIVQLRSVALLAELTAPNAGLAVPAGAEFPLMVQSPIFSAAATEVPFPPPCGAASLYTPPPSFPLIVLLVSVALPELNRPNPISTGLGPVDPLPPPDDACLSAVFPLMVELLISSVAAVGAEPFP